MPGLGPSWEPIRMNVCVTFVDWMDESDERHRSGWASWHCHLYVRRGDDEVGAGEKRKFMSMCMHGSFGYGGVTRSDGVLAGRARTQGIEGAWCCSMPRAAGPGTSNSSPP